MILVVFAHVEIFSLHYTSYIGQLFQLFRMPLFFFISGFFAYKEKADNATLNKGLKRRIQVLLFPALFFGLTYTYFAGHNITEFIYSRSKLGYWFTLVLLQMSVILYSYLFLTRKGKNKSQQTCILLLITSIIFFFLKNIIIHIPFLKQVGNILCLHQLFYYFQFFSFGYIASKNFKKHIIGDRVITLVLILFTVNSLIRFKMGYENMNYGLLRAYRFILDPMLGYTGITFVLALFRKYQNLFSSTNKIGESLIFIGKRTLDIYLIHYFILPQLPQVGSFFRQMNNDVIEFSTGILLSFLIVAFCLLISYVIRASDFLSHLLLGAKGSNKN